MRNISDQITNSRRYHLYEITDLIKESLLDLSEDEFWVEAQLIADRGGLKSGHYYCELTDVDEAGNTVAKIRATIWRSNYSHILEKLHDAGMPDALKTNSEVCVLCSVRYHDIYGLSLDIKDIDPSFGESQINRNRSQIIDKLSKKGILKKNAETNLPQAALRVGLITSKESAAYNDFIKTLFSSTFSFRVILAGSAMQGENTASEVVSAIELLSKTEVEVMCLVRGGGSQVDLAWFDNEEIARAIAGCPVPVWVGIGHEIDTGVLDVVAHTSFKTPTAVAEMLVNRLRELQNGQEIAANLLRDAADRQLALAVKELQRDIQDAYNGFGKHYEITSQQFRNSVLKTGSSFGKCFSSKISILGLKYQTFRDRCSWLLDLQQKGLKRKSSRIQLPRFLNILADRGVTLEIKENHLNAILPEQLLSKGYTITRNLQGTIVRSIKLLQNNDVINTQFADGYARSVVQKTEDIKNEAKS